MLYMAVEEEMISRNPLFIRSTIPAEGQRGDINVKHKFNASRRKSWRE